MSKTIYIDQDGVLARWRDVPVEKTRRPLYYLFLRPERSIVRLVSSLTAKGYDLTALHG